ncbi:alcohol oxidase [Mycena polygramma]|nr:alcohol oxidase [Mycena polygramma]
MIPPKETAGLTLATRLSEDPCVSVLVLEAGPANLDDPDIRWYLRTLSDLVELMIASWSHPPNLGPDSVTLSTIGAFKRSHKNHATAGPSPLTDEPSGKGLGGSSALNYMQYHRPSKSDIDAFGELGNKGWNWELLDRYYSKSEQFIQPVKNRETLNYALDHHGMDGPLAVSYPPILSTLEIPYEMAMQRLGIDFAENPFAGNTTGTWLTPMTIDPAEGIRSYSANVTSSFEFLFDSELRTSQRYYQPNASRENLTVVVCAHVTKIVTEVDEHGCATAVEVVFLNEEAHHIVKVGKEVILSAGTIMSPQILELSGIGNTAILERAGIQTRVHLPGAGENVQEHVFASVYAGRAHISFEFFKLVIFSSLTIAFSETSPTNFFGMAPTCVSFVPLASISPAHETLQECLTKSIYGGISSKQIPPSLQKQYDIQLKHLQDNQPSCEFILWPLFKPIPSDPIDVPAPGKQHLTTTALLNNPFSRGSIVSCLLHIASSDPLVPPNIDPKYFECEYGPTELFLACCLIKLGLDLLQLVEQIKFCRKIIDQEPLKKFLTGVEIRPGPDVQTDEQIAGPFVAK